jgi:hypothetical protein
MEVARDHVQGLAFLSAVCSDLSGCSQRVSYPYCLDAVIRISLYWWNCLLSEEVGVTRAQKL